MKNDKELIFFVSHKYNKKTHKKYLNLKDGKRSKDKLVWAMDKPEEGVLEKINTGLVYKFDSDQFVGLEYKKWRGGMIPGNCHYPLMSFISNSKEKYKSIWFIEYDVEYTGQWGKLFDRIRGRNSDFIASHLRFKKQEPRYKWWDLDGNVNIQDGEKVRSFNPVFKIKRDALECIHEHHKSGWNGHNEVMFPTILGLNGYSLSDFGGHGPLVPKGCTNENYLENDLDFCGVESVPKINNGSVKLTKKFVSTMRSGPCYNMTMKISDKLYHPVKDKSYFVVTKRNIKNTLHRLKNKFQHEG